MAESNITWSSITKVMDASTDLMKFGANGDVNKVVNNGLLNFAVFWRVGGYNSEAETFNLTLYLYARKTSAGSDENSQNDFKVTWYGFDTDSTSLTYTETFNKIIPPYKNKNGVVQKVAYWGHHTFTGLTTNRSATNAKIGVKITGIHSDTVQATGTWECIKECNFDTSAVTPSISEATTTSLNMKITGCKADRKFRNFHRWYIRKPGESDFELVKTDNILYDGSEGTVFDCNFTGLKPCSKYDLRWKIGLRNYNEETDKNTYSVYMEKKNRLLTVYTKAKVVNLPKTESSYTYNGQKRTFLSGGSGYSISSGTNSATNVGTYSVTVKPTEEYNWDNQGTSQSSKSSQTFNWQITPKSIRACTISLSANKFTYNGSTRKPTITVKDGTTTLTLGTHYTVTYQGDTLNAGNYGILIQGKGNYSESVTEVVTINPKELSSSMISAISDQIFDGTPKNPIVTVKDGTTTLTLGTHYDITGYSNNIHVSNTLAGSYASVKIRGVRNYIGTVSKNFIIKPKNISNLTVTLNLPTNGYTYDKTAKTPTVTVKDGTKVLPNTDYIVSYSNNTNAGTATARVVMDPKSDYTGEKSINFTINRKPITTSMINLSSSSYTYGNVERKPTVTLKDGDTTFASDKYTVSYSNNTDAGTATVKVTIDTSVSVNYTGSATKEFTIDRKPITASMIKLSYDSCTYNGSKREPDVTLSDYVTFASDKYTVSYSNNTDAGTATVKVTIDTSVSVNYTGSATKEFTIDRKDVSDLNVSLSNDLFTYDGTSKTPDVTVKDGTKVLIENTDYTLAYSDINRINVGNYIIKLTGKGNYIGLRNEGYTITNEQITDFNITLSNKEYTYDGTAKEPTVTVKDGDITLTEDTDYTVEYINNIDAGEAKVKIKGKNGYIGSKEEPFTILPMVVINPFINIPSESDFNYIYDGLAKEPTITVSLNDNTITSDNYILKYTNNINAGDRATVTVTFTGNYSGTDTKTFTIKPLALTNTNIVLPLENEFNYSYDGTAKEPIIKVENLDDNTIISDNNYTVEYTDNIQIGTATVTVTFTGNYSGTATKTFEIILNSISSEKIEMVVSEGYNRLIYDGTSKIPSFKLHNTVSDIDLVENVDYTLELPEDSINVGIKTLIIVGIGKYTDNKQIVYYIDPRPTENNRVTLSSDRFTYDGMPKIPEIHVFEGENEIDESYYDVTFGDNVNAGEVEILITFKDNYTGTLIHSFIIDKADPELSFSDGYYIELESGEMTEIQPVYFGNGNIIVNSLDTEIAMVLNEEEDDDDILRVAIPSRFPYYKIKALLNGTTEIEVICEESDNYIRSSNSVTIKVRSTIKFGERLIDNIYFGDKKIEKVFIGRRQIFKSNNDML